MNGNVKFSIIMPCYNSESYVRDAVDSILAQTYPNWELIAVNDGSTDSTEEILKSYSKSDERIKVYSKENGGYVSAVNLGLDKITGNYFLLLGSDDRLSGNLFEVIAEHIPDDVLPGCISFITEKIKNGKSMGLDTYTEFDSVAYENNISLREMREKYPAHSNILCSRDTSKCFLTDKLGDLRYYGKYGIDADGIFSILFCHKVNSFLSVPVIGYYWTLRDDSVSGRKQPEVVCIDRINNWQLFFDEITKLEKSEITEDEREYLVYYIKIIANLCNEAQYPGSYKRNRKIIRCSTAKAKQYLIHFSMYGDHTDLRLFVNFPALFAFYRRVINAVKKLLRRE